MMADATPSAAGGRLRAVFAEGVGTLLLLATIVGSGIMGQAGAAGQEAAALLPHALAIGAMLFVLISLLGPVSGAHFNPAVTMVFALRGAISWRRAAIFILVQIAAGIAGVLLAHVMFDVAVLQSGTKPRTGIGQWSAEVVATAGLIIVILGGLRNAPAHVPALVGLYIGAAIWFTASAAFANPAVSLARSFTDTFAGIRPIDVLPFMISQCVGALAGLGIAVVLFPASTK